jgi:DNA-binding transcriptional LysR family regulator
MNLRQIKYFVAVSEELHFRNAARRLNISQPPLTRQIKDLEEDLGVALFVRGKHGVSPTPAGRRLLPHAQRILKSVETASRAARWGESNSITIGFVSSASVLVPSISRQIRACNPEIDLQLIEEGSARQHDMLRVGELDIALVRGPWANTGYISEEVSRDKLALIVPNDHPRAGDLDLKLADLASESFVFFPRELGPGFFDTAINACYAAGFSPVMNQVAGSTLTMIALVASGQGFSLVPSSLAVMARGVTVLYPSDLNSTTQLLAAYPEECKRSEPTASVIKVLKGFSDDSSAFI